MWFSSQLGREHSRCWICILAVRWFLAAFKDLGLLMNSWLARVEERWTAKLPRQRRLDNRLQPFVRLRNLASVDLVDVVNFDLRAVFCWKALILSAFRVLFGDGRPVVALLPSGPNHGDQRRNFFLHDRSPACVSIVAMGSWSPLCAIESA